MLGTSFMTALAIAFGMEITAEIVVETWWKEQEPNQSSVEAEYVPSSMGNVPTLEKAGDVLYVNQPTCRVDGPLMALEKCGGLAHVRINH
tara:strand:+ start:273 stop:542 length:270 start_codon:yes stop_codon:yes gene_type:complete